MLKFRNRALEDLFVRFIEKTGEEEYFGPEPPGYVETEAQALLDKMRGPP